MRIEAHGSACFLRRPIMPPSRVLHCDVCARTLTWCLRALHPPHAKTAQSTLGPKDGARRRLAVIPIYVHTALHIWWVCVQNTWGVQLWSRHVPSLPNLIDFCLLLSLSCIVLPRASLPFPAVYQQQKQEPYSEAAQPILLNASPRGHANVQDNEPASQPGWLSIPCSWSAWLTIMDYRVTRSTDIFGQGLWTDDLCFLIPETNYSDPQRPLCHQALVLSARTSPLLRATRGLPPPSLPMLRTQCTSQDGSSAPPFCSHFHFHLHPLPACEVIQM